MIIILEGPDGSGKSTLAGQLQARYGLDYHHEGPPPADKPALDHYVHVLKSFQGRRLVIDRFALGERVYGPLHRGVDRLGELGWQQFSQVAFDMRVFQVMCLPRFQTCLEAWQSGRTEMITDKQVFLQTYLEFARLSTNPDGSPAMFIYNWQDPFHWADLCQSLDYHTTHILKEAQC
jgi:hypothetical protein